jgi:hypothetical protein
MHARAASHALWTAVLSAGSLACSGLEVPGASSSSASSSGDAAVTEEPSRFATRIASVTLGENSGHGRQGLPDIVLGPPKGAGEYQGSLETLSLGTGGSITLETGVAMVDGPGPDFTVFENAFRVRGSTLAFMEPGAVSVSEDGVTFTAFPCDHQTRPYAGCAGRAPVLSTGEPDGPDPNDPDASGGDLFDLADIRVARARFIRIEDRSPPAAAPTAGFDLDAVVVLNAEP